jgi:hypothetical protein
VPLCEEYSVQHIVSAHWVYTFIRKGYLPEYGMICLFSLLKDCLNFPAVINIFSCRFFCFILARMNSRPTKPGKCVDWYIIKLLKLCTFGIFTVLKIKIVIFYSWHHFMSLLHEWFVFIQCTFLIFIMTVTCFSFWWFVTGLEKCCNFML